MVGASQPRTMSGESHHWNERAGALLACILHAGALEGARLDEVVSRVNQRDVDRQLTILARHGSTLAFDLLTGLLSTDPRELSGIWSTASSTLAGYRTATALQSADGEQLDPVRFVEESATLYVVASSEHQQHSAPLVAGVLRAVRSAAYHRARTNLATHTPAAPVLFALDELAGIAPLHDLPTLIAEGASQGVVTLACLQDLSQARARFGPIADGFLSLFSTKVVLPGLGDTRTLEALSVLGGHHLVERRSTHRNHLDPLRRRASTTIATERVPVLSPSAIARAPRGTALVFFGAEHGRVRLLTPARRERNVRADGPLR